ncbi:MAG: hypothetical protein AAF959_12425 [Cyanobacteria bacterium P01_D01_bin.56]
MDDFMGNEIDFEELRWQLFDIYQQQIPLHQSIVQLSSIFYGPTSLTHIATALNYLGITTKTDKQFTPSNLKPHITHLIEGQLLIHGAGHLPQCHPLLVELVTRNAMQLDLFEPMLHAAKSVLHARRPTGRTNRIRHICRSKDELYREARFALYSQDYNGLPQLFLDYSNYNYYATPVTFEDFLLEVTNNPFDVDWLRTLPPENYSAILRTQLIEATSLLEPADHLLELLEEQNAQSNGLNILLVEQYLLRNRLGEAEALLDKAVDESSQVYATALRGALALLQEGDLELSLSYYKTATKLARKQLNKKAVIGGIAGLFYMLGLIKSKQPQHLKEAITLSTPLLQNSGYLSNAFHL